MRIPSYSSCITSSGRHISMLKCGPQRVNACDHVFQPAECIDSSQLPHISMSLARSAGVRSGGVSDVGETKETGQSKPFVRRSTVHCRQKRCAPVPTMVPVNSAAAGWSADTTTSQPRTSTSADSPIARPSRTVIPASSARSDAPMDVPSGQLGSFGGPLTICSMP